MNIKQAADFLNVSEEYVMHLYEDGQFPVYRTEAGLRIKESDLWEYKQKMIEASNKAMDELAELTQELNLP